MLAGKSEIRTLTLRGRLLALPIAAVIVCLYFWVNPLFWLIWNTAILLSGIGMAIWALMERWSLVYGFVALALGVGIHWWAVNSGIEAGRCAGVASDQLLTAIREIDTCIEYEDSVVFHGQVALISGAVVLMVHLFWWLGALRYRNR